MRTPSRRSLLSTVGVAALSGCFDALPGFGSTSNDDPGLTDALPDEPDPGVLPAYHADRLVDWADTDPTEAPLSLEPSADAVADGETITFTLHNRSETDLSVNPYRWKLHKRVGRRWYELEPETAPNGTLSVAPERDRPWELQVANDAFDPADPVDRASGYASAAVQAIGGGAYAFGLVVDAGGAGEIGLGTRFTVDADDLQVAPTDAVEQTGQDGGTLVAEATWGDSDAERARRGAYELELVEQATNPEPVIAETALRDRRLRDALGLALDQEVDHVRIEAVDATTPIFGGPDGTYEYDGQAFEVTTSELDED